MLHGGPPKGPLAYMVSDLHPEQFCSERQLLVTSGDSSRMKGRSMI